MASLKDRLDRFIFFTIFSREIQGCCSFSILFTRVSLHPYAASNPAKTAAASIF